MEDKLTPEEQKILLVLARQAMVCAVKGEPLSPLDPSALTPRLQEQGASFITLTIGEALRGCIGALEPYQSLAEDVREHAAAAALQDPRFPPVSDQELSRIEIEISRLTRPIPLEYRDPDDLLSKLRPGVDGVILRDDHRRSTFLPQVWEKLPDPAEFLTSRCYKMGADPHLWQKKHLEVLVYQVEEFRESTNL